MTGQALTFDATPEEMVLFLSEGEEQMELLSQDLLRLEHEGDGNSALLQEIFRAAHTLKGSSGAIGHQRMARLTHALETVLDHVRHHTLPITTQLIDLLLRGLDALRVLLDEVTTLVESDIAIDDLCSALVALTTAPQEAAPAQGQNSPSETPGATPSIAAPTPGAEAARLEKAALPGYDRREQENTGRDASRPYKDQGADPSRLPSPQQGGGAGGGATTPPMWRIEAAIAESCLLPAVRALQVVLAAGALGMVVRSDPAQETIESGNVATGATISLWLAPSAPTDAMTIGRIVGNVLEVTINSVTPEGAAGAPDAANPGNVTGDAWQIRATIHPNCPLPAARALQIVLACGALGQVRASEPTLEAIETGQANTCHQVDVVVAAATSLAALRVTAQEAIERIPEVVLASVTLHGKERAVETAPTGVPPQSPPAWTGDGRDVSRPALPSPSADGEKGSRAATGGLGMGPHPAAGKAPAASAAPRMVRIDVERLDALMNLVGELVIDRTRLARIAGKVGLHAGDPALVEELTETCRHLARISDDLQDEVMRSRMLPIESVFSKFPRLVRDLAQKINKKIDFIVEGKDTELDRSVAEQIGDPIIHLLRNAIDHGIEPTKERSAAGKSETGQVRLAARHEENQIVIDVEDDGRGINAETLKQKAVSKGIIAPEVAARMGQREALELIFASGFSTTEQISDISGRGVGMDIVRTNVERLNGTIMVETEVGQGTRFTVRLPLTLAIIRALLVEVAGQTYAIPLTSVVEALRIQHESVRAVNGHEAIELRGQVLPLVRLRDIFAKVAPHPRAEDDGTRHDTEATRKDAEYLSKSRAVPRSSRVMPRSGPAANEGGPPSRQFVVAVRWGERRGGLMVDALIGEQEIVIKPLGKLFRNAHGVSGGAVLGDGQVAPILDIAALIKQLVAVAHRGDLLQGASA
jgi:two-component system chemotaxis sensor kinase CheA